MNGFVCFFPSTEKSGRNVCKHVEEMLQTVSLAKELSDDGRVFYFRKESIAFANSFLKTDEERRLFRKRFYGLEEAESSFHENGSLCKVMGAPVANDAPIALTAVEVLRHPEDAYLSVMPDKYSKCRDITVCLGSEMVCIDRSDSDAKSVLGWLFSHRRPKRVFQANPKHGKNTRQIKGMVVSPFNYNTIAAQFYLNRAVVTGTNNLLVAFDSNQSKYLLFRKHDKNCYHGYCPDDPISLNKRTKDLLDVVSGIK